jgi:hypothetical protein
MNESSVQVTMDTVAKQKAIPFVQLKHEKT